MKKPARLGMGLSALMGDTQAPAAAPTQTINDLDRSMRLIEEVLRHIIVQIDKVEMPESPEEPSPAEAEAPAPAVEAEAAVAEAPAPESPAVEDAETPAEA